MHQRTYGKELTLDDLSSEVSVTEGAFGSSTEVVTLPALTGVTFDGGPPPDGPIKIQRTSKPKPEGGEEIYTGTAWDEDERDVPVTAYRMPAA